MINKVVLSMAILRMLSGTIELIAAILMLRLNQIDRALLVNSSLAVIGPLVLLTTTAIGLSGLADKLSFSKFLLILCGVCLIFIGVLKK